MKEFDEYTLAEKIVIKRKCQQSLLNFTVIFFEMLQGEKFRLNWHHRYIFHELEKIIRGKSDNPNTIINLPPGGTKTEIISIHLPAYCNMLVSIGELDKVRNLNLSYADTLVKRNSRRTRDIINSEEYRTFWPCQFGVNQDQEWEIINDKGKTVSTTVSKSSGGQVTGSRGGYMRNPDNPRFTGSVNLDDFDKPKDMFSETKRENNQSMLTNTIRSRRADEHTPVLAIAQRLHIEDSSGYLLNGGMGINFRNIIIPGLINQSYIDALPSPINKICEQMVKKHDPVQYNGEDHWSYWHEKESAQDYLHLLERDDYTFHSQVMQKPVKPGGNLIDIDWFNTYTALPRLNSIKIFVDTNSGKVTDRNDFNVFTVAGIGEDNNIYILEVSRAKFDVDELKDEANRLWEYWRTDTGNNKQPCLYMSIEDKQAGQGLITQLKKAKSISVVPVQRGNNQNKYVRFQNIKHEIKQGRVYIPDHNCRDANGNRVTDIPLWNCKHRSASTMWVSEFLSEAANLNVGVLLDQESGFDDQMDTLFDCLDDFCLQNGGVNISAMTSNLSHILGY